MYIISCLALWSLLGLISVKYWCKHCMHAIVCIVCPRTRVQGGADVRSCDCRPWFFLQPGYWHPRRKSVPNLRQRTSQPRRAGSTNPEEGLVNGDAGETLDPDVAAEEARVGSMPQFAIPPILTSPPPRNYQGPPSPCLPPILQGKGHASNSFKLWPRCHMLLQQNIASLGQA